MIVKQAGECFDEECLEFYVHTDGYRLYTAITEYRIIAINTDSIKDLEVFKDPIVHACASSDFILTVPLDSNTLSVHSLATAAPITT